MLVSFVVAKLNAETKKIRLPTMKRIVKLTFQSLISMRWVNVWHEQNEIYSKNQLKLSRCYARRS